MTNNQLQILELELQKKKHVFDYLQKKLDRYKRANNKVQNVISEEEIEDVLFQIKTSELEISILQTKIKDIYDAS